MARDYLPIQGTSVPCERAFSSSKLTDGDSRTRLTTHHFGLLQIAKKHMMGERREREEELKAQRVAEQERWAGAVVVSD